MINKILVPLDGSECAYKALDWALDLADKYNARVELVTIIPTTAFTLIGPSEKELYKRAETLLKDALNNVGKNKSSLKLSTKIRVGRPAETVIEIANEENFDLIVIGGHGCGRVEEFFLGSVSDRVADTARCPVVIVK